MSETKLAHHILQGKRFVSDPTNVTTKLMVGSNLHGTGDGISLDGVITVIWGQGVPTPPVPVKFSNGVVRTIAGPN